MADEQLRPSERERLDRYEKILFQISKGCLDGKGLAEETLRWAGRLPPKQTGGGV